MANKIKTIEGKVLGSFLEQDPSSFLVVSEIEDGGIVYEVHTPYPIDDPLDVEGTKEFAEGLYARLEKAREEGRRVVVRARELGQQKMSEAQRKFIQGLPGHEHYESICYFSL